MDNSPATVDPSVAVDQRSDAPARSMANPSDSAASQYLMLARMRSQSLRGCHIAGTPSWSASDSDDVTMAGRHSATLRYGWTQYLAAR
jgi:hypothetical protein